MRLKKWAFSVCPFHPITFFFLTFALLWVLFSTGCSREEQPLMPEPKQVVRKKMPPFKMKPAPKPPDKKEAPAPAPKMASKPPQKPPEPAKPPVKAVEAPTVEGGIYRVQKGDTLAKIAQNPDVYGNADLWPSLVRLNREALKSMGFADGLQTKALPPGMTLKYVTSEALKKNRTALGKKVYVINVFSSLKPEKAESMIYPLLEAGHQAYMMKAEVKGKQWTRLRVGFFNDKAQAQAAREKIKSVVEAASDAWIARMGPQEWEQFAGF